MSDTVTADVVPTRRFVVRPTVWIVSAETLLLAVLTIWRIGAKSFWLDEAYSWSTASRSWSSLMHLLWTSEVSAALYSTMSWAWVHVSSSEAFLRAPSAVFVVGALPVLYLTTRRLFDERTAVVAGLLFAVNANLVTYGQEARTYALVLCLGVVSSYFLVRTVDEGSPVARRAWIITGALLGYSHMVGLFVLGAEVVSLAVLPRAVLAARKLVSAVIALAIAVSPMVILLLVQSGTITWTSERPTPRFVWSTFSGLAGNGTAALTLVAAALGLVMLAAAWRCWRADGRSIESWRYGFPLCWLFVPIAAMLASSLVQPALVYRFMVPAVPGLVVVVACGVTSLRDKRLAALLLALVVALSTVGLYRWFVDVKKEDWRSITAYVARGAEPGDVILFAGDEARIPFEYYIRNDSEARRRLTPVFPSAAWGGFRTGDQRIALPSERLVREIAARHNRVWVVVSHAGPNDDRREARDRLASLRVQHHLQSTRTFPLHEQVELFVQS